MTTAPARSAPAARRGGFTLIELLVVISLLAVLMALAAGAFFRVRATQQSQATQSTLNKLNTLLNQRWTEVLGKSKSPPQPVVDFAEGDKDRAVALWSYAKLVNEFPETRDEALFTVVMDPAATSVATANQAAVLKPRGVFAAVANQVTAAQAAANPEEVAAALFLAAITQTGDGGAAWNDDGLNQQIGEAPNTKLRVFKDSWGTPITFVRWRTQVVGPADMDRPPYVRPSVVRSSNGSTVVTSVNSLDPQARLFLWTGSTWSAAARNLALQRLNPAGTSNTQFLNKGIIPTVVSAGPNKLYYAGAAVGNLFNGDDAGNDNVVGFRLRREGNKGD